MALAGIHVPVVGHTPHKGCCSVCVPRVSSSCLLPLPEILQDQQACLIQAPLKSLLLPWVLEQVRLCVCAVRVSLYFPQPF